MDAMTISDALGAMIDGREVQQAFFTSYSFEPDFFELELLPLLLGNPALSRNDSIRYYQLQNWMAKNITPCAVVYDETVFAPQLAPRLEVDYLPMRVGGACQHAKLTVLQLQDQKTKESSILLGAGSFNLTKAGWWENLEVGHWVELSTDNAPANIRSDLLRALRFYQSKTPTPVLDALLEVTEQLVPTENDPSCHFYFSGAGNDHLHFDRYLQEHKVSTDNDLEVISPFFALDGDNRIITEFLERYPSACVLLPKDEKKQALVDQALYEAFCQYKKLEWGQWKKSIEKSHISSAGVHRPLHAKIYQSGGDAPWFFVGSVNLSFKAFRQNVEAGFLLKGGEVSPLLKKLEQQPDRFKVETEAQSAVAEGVPMMPLIKAFFDWKTAQLELVCESSGTLTLQDALGTELAVATFDGESVWQEKAETLKTELQKSSLVRARWQAENEAEGLLLVSQRHLFCRPNELPPHDLQELLRIYLGMHPAKRMDLIGDLAIRLLNDLRKDGLEDEFLPELDDKEKVKNFFAEFSQVNGAFWELSAQLAKAKEEGDQQTLAYYLEGQQPDSLRKVMASISQTPQQDKEASLIVRYLTLLSIEDLLQRYSDHDGRTEKPLLPEVQTLLSAIEEKELLPKLDAKDGQRYLQWIKAKFHQPVADLTRAGRGEVEA